MGPCHTGKALPTPRIRFVFSTDGEMLATAQHGGGPSLLRFSHWLSNLELDWESPVRRPLIDRLGERLTLHRYDQRGTGLSTRDVSRINLEAFVEDLGAVADAAGLERFALFARSSPSPSRYVLLRAILNG